jgi:hypothetical protein
MAANSRIKNSLQPKFRQYYENGTGGSRLTFEERRLLDAVRDSPSKGQLFALTPLLVGAGSTSSVAKDALYNVGVALGARSPEVGSVWQRVTQLEDYDYFRELEGRPAEDYRPEGETPTIPGRVNTDQVDNRLGPNFFNRIKTILPPVAVKYLATGEYPAVATFGEPYLTANQRAALKAFALTPSTQTIRGITSVVGEEQTLQIMNVVDEMGAEVVSPAMAENTLEEQRKPDKDNPPSKKLPEGQRYEWSEDLKLYKVVEDRVGLSQPVFVRYSNGMGETVDSKGNLVEAPAPAPGFGPEGGTLAPARAPSTAAAAPTGPTAAQTEAAAFAQAEFGVGSTADAYAAAEFGVGGPASGRGFSGTVQGGYQGGGAGGGGVGGGVPAAVVETPPVPFDWETAAQEMYPEYYAIVKNNPEIAELLKKAMGPPEWSEQKFAAELRGTNWYQTTTAAAREWDTASALDPASYQAKVDEAASAIQTEALNLGIRLSDATLQKLALDSQRLGWGAQTITNAIGMAATEGGSEGATQLREGYYGQSVRNLAKQYGVTLADQTFNSFINKIAVGEETLGSFQDYAMTIGKSLYPPLAEQFDAGRTFEDITASYKNIAADILERNANSIDMAKPEWVQAITYVPDAKTGEQRLMNMAEWGDYLRKTESLGYQNTTQARARAYQVTTKIANLFGRV